MLLDTVQSMGKKCTAQRLENVVQKNMLSLTNTNRILGRTSNSSCAMQNPPTNTAYNEIQNGNAAICGSASLEQCNRGNLAICNGETLMEPDNNAGEINIEEESNQETIDESDSYEINYSFSEETGIPSVENGAVDLFERNFSPMNSGELEMTGSQADTVQSEQSVNDEPEKIVSLVIREKLVLTKTWLQVPIIQLLVMRFRQLG